jgi:hypothetical protein
MPAILSPGPRGDIPTMRATIMHAGRYEPRETREQAATAGVLRIGLRSRCLALR